jgi:5-methyltetrahydropteroyltriglutamate--homocysteine methyltransferase
MTARSKPPFRADMVGSLLRTAPLKEARARRAEGAISAAELESVEDAEIRKIVAKQEEVGLQAVTDGEFRRSWWHYDFLWNLKGVVKTEVAQGIQFAGVQTKAEAPKVVGRIAFDGHPMIDHFRFLKSVASRTAKMTIPGPSMLHYRGGRAMVDQGVYPDMEAFFDDLGAAYASTVRAFYGAGCRYLQLDDISFAYLCDPKQREMLRARGDDPVKQPLVYAGLLKRALAGRPRDMAVTMHLCRGNFRSTFVASGGYEPVADLLFNGTDVDGFFMEWDTERAGGFEPLRFVPEGKIVVLGLVTSKTGALERKDDLKRRIEEAARFTDLDRLCLSPQCGFASTEEGNTLTEDDQWRKLELVVETAREVWG